MTVAASEITTLWWDRNVYIVCYFIVVIIIINDALLKHSFIRAQMYKCTCVMYMCADQSTFDFHCSLIVHGMLSASFESRQKTT